MRQLQKQIWETHVVDGYELNLKWMYYQDGKAHVGIIGKCKESRTQISIYFDLQLFKSNGESYMTIEGNVESGEDEILLRVESDTMEAAGAASWSLSFKYTTDPNIEAQRQYIEKRDYVNAVVNVCNNTAFNLIDSVYEPKWLRAMIILRVHFHGR